MPASGSPGFCSRRREVGETCGGVGVVGVGVEETAVGGFGSGEIVGGLGDLGGEEDVVGSLGGEFDGCEEGIAGGGGIGWLDL